MTLGMNLWGERFDQLTRRERVLIALALGLVVGLLLYLPLSSLLQQRTMLSAQIDTLSAQNKIASQQIDLYRQALTRDPDQASRQRLQQLQRQQKDLDKQLAFQMVDMIPAEQMPGLLSDLLERSKGIKLLAFDSLPPTPLLLPDQARHQGSAPAPAPAKHPDKSGDGQGKHQGGDSKLNLYSHGIRLQFEGDYFATLTFIEALEAMPNKLYWRRLDYVVGDYPKAKVMLELYTLSINKDFISVANRG